MPNYENRGLQPPPGTSFGAAGTSMMNPANASFELRRIAALKFQLSGRNEDAVGLYQGLLEETQGTSDMERRDLQEGLATQRRLYMSSRS